MNKKYASLVDALKDLKTKGYTENLELEEEFIVNVNKDIELSPGEFEVDAMHRFEGMTNPADCSILYAISSQKHNLKGVVTDTYGPGGQPVSPEMAEKLRYEPSTLDR